MRSTHPTRLVRYKHLTDTIHPIVHHTNHCPMVLRNLHMSFFLSTTLFHNPSHFSLTFTPHSQTYENPLRSSPKVWLTSKSLEITWLLDSPKFTHRPKWRFPEDRSKISTEVQPSQRHHTTVPSRTYRNLHTNPASAKKRELNSRKLTPSHPSDHRRRSERTLANLEV